MLAFFHIQEWFFSRSLLPPAERMCREMQGDDAWNSRVSAAKTSTERSSLYCQGCRHLDGDAYAHRDAPTTRGQDRNGMVHGHQDSTSSLWNLLRLTQQGPHRHISPLAWGQVHWDFPWQLYTVLLGRARKQRAIFPTWERETIRNVICAFSGCSVADPDQYMTKFLSVKG